MSRPTTTRKPVLRQPTVRKKKALPKRKAIARKKTLHKRKAIARKKTLHKRKAIARKKTLHKRKAIARKKTLHKRKAIAGKKTLHKRKAIAGKKTLPKRKAKAGKKTLPKRKAIAGTVRPPRLPRLSKVESRLFTMSADHKITRAILKDIAANQKRADARGDKIDARIDELVKAVSEDRKAASETRKAVSETRKTVSRIGKTLGDVENRWGEFVEALLVGDAHKVLNGYQGIEVGPIAPAFPVVCDDKERELDAVAFGADMVVIIEAKSRLREGHIGKFIGNVLQRFTEMMPAFRGKKIYGAVGYLNADSKTIEFAQKKGLIVLRTVHKTKEVVGEKSKFKIRNFHP